MKEIVVTSVQNTEVLPRQEKPWGWIIGTVAVIALLICTFLEILDRHLAFGLENHVYRGNPVLEGSFRYAVHYIGEVILTGLIVGFFKFAIGGLALFCFALFALCAFYPMQGRD